AMIVATRPTTRPSASISTHFFSTVAAFADWAVLVSAFMARSLTDMDRSMSAPKQRRRLSRRDEAALRSGPMAPNKRKVKHSAALLTGIMIPLISRRRFQRAHALLDQPAAVAARLDDPALATLAQDQPRITVDGPQIVDLERLDLSGDRRRIALDHGDRPPGTVVGYRYLAIL